MRNMIDILKGTKDSRSDRQTATARSLSPDSTKSPLFEFPTKSISCNNISELIWKWQYIGKHDFGSSFWMHIYYLEFSGSYRRVGE